MFCVSASKLLGKIKYVHKTHMIRHGSHVGCIRVHRGLLAVAEGLVDVDGDRLTQGRGSSGG